MELFFVSFVIIGLSLIGMAVGVIMKRAPIKGSCGGLNNVEGLENDCPVCGGDQNKCESTQQ